MNYFTLLLTTLLALLLSAPTLSNATTRNNNSSEYANSNTCAQCHQKEYNLWRKSHHAQAMQKASAKTVLGNFNNAAFNYYGDITTFYKKNGNYFINTLGADGKKHDFVVKYTFGISPLQQYLIALPHGRLQAFTIAWDVKNKKWFHLYPEEKIGPDNPLHWSKRSFTWNINCAECHSTNLQKKYDPETKSYHTSWSEINVGCQACHGPGSQHLKWAKGQSSRKANLIKNKGLLKNSAQLTPKQQIEQCASCHSRRHRVSTDDKFGDSLFDHFMPALLRADLYHPDGQIKDEVFVYGSFLQSKMHRAGVTCLDCHNPHSLTLKLVGNALCTQCHNDNPPKRFNGLKRKNYNDRNHSHHKAGSAGTQCINCHMPAKTYMRIDPRRDHSFRIPRPDLSEKIGVPNACNQCHSDKTAKWASQHIEKWFGKKVYPKHFGELFKKTQSAKQTRETEAELITLSRNKKQPDIIRATAIELLAQYNSPKSIKARIDALSNQNVLIRTTALRTLAILPKEKRISILAPYLADPVRAVRIEAAAILASIPKNEIPEQYRKAYQLAIDEYKALQKSNLDMPGSHFNLGNLYQKQDDYNKAAESYQAAIELDKHFYPAQHNLASLLNTMGQKQKAEEVLREAISNNKEHGELYYALGLLLGEQKKLKEAMLMLAKAANLLPNNSRVQYNYGLALQHNGDFKAAEAVLKKAHQLNVHAPDILYALTILYVQQKEWDKALEHAKKLSLLFPNSNRIKELRKYIEMQRSISHVMPDNSPAND